MIVKLAVIIAQVLLSLFFKMKVLAGSEVGGSLVTGPEGVVGSGVGVGTRVVILELELWPWRAKAR